MSQAAYRKKTCRCGKEVSAAGAPWHSHMMAHVRRGEAVATQPYLDIYVLGDRRRYEYVFVWVGEPTRHAENGD